MLAWIWRPVISPLHVFAMTALLAALAIFMYARSMRDRPWTSLGLLAMRLAVLVALALLLMGPSIVPPSATKLGRGKLFILADTSRSMLTEDVGGQSRLAAVQKNWLADERLRELAKTSDLKFFALDIEARAQPAAALRAPAGQVAVGRRSNIAAGVEALLQQTNTDSSDVAFLLLSDGRDSKDSPMRPVALLARARGIPIYTVCVGGPTIPKDIVLTAMPSQRYLLAGKEGHILIRLHQSGLDELLAEREAANPLTVHIKYGDEETVLPVKFEGKATASVELPVKHDASGLYEYSIRVDAAPGEMESDNNAQTVFVEVVDQRISVLILEGEPHWDTKFIAQSLRKDPRVSLAQITKISEAKESNLLTRAKGRDCKLPTTAEELSEYDVIVLGRGLENLLPSETAKLLPAYVSDYGGNVVFARGRAYDSQTPSGRQLGRDIAVIEPIVWGKGLLHNLSLSTSSAGRSAFLGEGVDEGGALAQLPDLQVMPAVARVKTGTVVLAHFLPAGRAYSAASESAPPAVVSMNYGRGRIVAVLGEGLWQWGFLPPGEAAKLKTRIYDELWSGMIGWLVMGGDFLPGENVSLLLGRSSVQLGESVLIESVCKSAPAGGFAPKVTLIAPDGEESVLALAPSAGSDTRLQGAARVDRVGAYTVVMECPQGKPARIEKRFSVYDVDMERLKVAADPEALAQLAEESGGAVFLAHQAKEFPQTVAAMQALRHGSPRAKFVWDKWAFLVVLLVWAGGEWIIRKRAGML